MTDLKQIRKALGKIASEIRIKLVANLTEFFKGAEFIPNQGE